MLSDAERQKQEDRRKYLLLLLALLVSDTAEGMALLAIAAQAPDNPVTLFTPAMSLLQRAHGDATRLGRTLAGAPHPFDGMDQLAGNAAAQEQSLYLSGFDADIANRRYIDNEGQVSEGAIRQRASLYALSLVGTANDAWRRTLPADEEVWWVMDPEERDHCSGCPAIEAKNPWTAGTLPTVPGAGDTPCLGHCKCSLRTADGLEAFPGGTSNG